MSRLVYVLQHRKLGYGKGIDLQRDLANVYNYAKDKQGRFRNVLVITEHEPVYTIGIRSKHYEKELEDRLKSLGAQFAKTDRGGLMTFHGPGQLIAYPILNLKLFTPSVRWYINRLEKTIIHLCKQYNINAASSNSIGVWVEDKKVCSIGVHCSRYITTHGLALNCNTDLSWFKHIMPCGMDANKLTSLSTVLQKNVSVQDAVPVFKYCFKTSFDCDLKDFDWREEEYIFKCS